MFLYLLKQNKRKQVCSVYFFPEIRKGSTIKLHNILIAKMNKISSLEEGGEKKNFSLALFLTYLSGGECKGKVGFVLATCHLVSFSKFSGKDARF
jgi:hypothetical protein